MPHGKLEVYVEGAVDIKDSNILGKGSPYCTLSMGSQEFSSPPIAEGGTRPFFNTNFEFQVDQSTEQMMVKIFSKKTLTDDDLLGYCTIVFKDAFYQSHVVPVTAYALTRPSGRPGGHIRLSLTFQARPRPAMPQPGGGYAAPQPRPAGPYRQPRPPPPAVVGGGAVRGGGVGRGPARPHPGEDPSYRRRSHPIDSGFADPPSRGQPYPGRGLPRRMNEEDSSSQSSGSHSDDEDTPPAPAPPGPLYQQPLRRRAPPGLELAHAPRGMNEEDSSSQSFGSHSDGDDTPPVPAPHGAVRQQPLRRPGAPPPGPNPGDRRRSMPNQTPPPNNNNSSSLLSTFGGALMQNVGGAIGGALVGALLNPDGETGSDWGGGGGDDEGSIGQIETASYGSGRSGSAIEEVGSYYEGGSSRGGAVEEADYDDGETSQGSYGAAPGPYTPAGGRGGPRGRGGPPVRGGRGVPRGRAGPPGRGRAGPPGGRAGPPPGGRAGPPPGGRGGVPIRGVVRGRGPPRGGAPPSMARGGPPPPM